MNDDITPEMQNERILANLETPNGDGDATKVTEPDATLVEVSQELGSILNSYVELLDKDNHGGWSWRDEARVRSAVSMLDRAGRGIHRRSIFKSRIANAASDTSRESGEQHTARRLRGVRTTKPKGGSTEQTRWATDGGGNLEPEAGL